jgi:hypothetical protein
MIIELIIAACIIFAHKLKAPGCEETLLTRLLIVEHEDITPCPQHHHFAVAETAGIMSIKQWVPGSRMDLETVLLQSC